jgi:segregation and condensation protein A
MTDVSVDEALEGDVELHLEDLEEPPTASSDPSVFSVRLENFEGPFDLLLNLISRRKLDVTEVALSQVTDEFISYLAGMDTYDLGKATEFLVVAATLLDLKTARLLPAADVENEDDLALLEARDLLFARLLQYRAYKLAADYLRELDRTNSRRYGRAVELEPRFAELLPEIVIGIDPGRFAALAASAMVPKPVPVVMTDHVHAPHVSVREHAATLRERLRRSGAANFRTLVSDCEQVIEVVARFLALLELYREGTVAFDQVAALAELRVRWTGGEQAADTDDADGFDDFDDSADGGSGVDMDEEYG